MKNTVLLVTLFYIQNILFAQIIQDPMLIKTKKAQENRVFNRVEKQTMFVYKVKGNGKLPKKGEFRNQITYNVQGKTLKHISHFPDISITNEMEYDEKGNCIKMISYDGHGKIRQTLIHEFDGNGKELRTKYINPDGTINSIKENREKNEGHYNVSYNDKGEITSKTENLYDSIQKIYISRLLSPSNELRYENKYFLNNKFQIIEWRVIDNVQNKKFIENTTYDSLGNETQLIRTDFEGNPIYKFEKKYNNKNLEIESVWFEPIDKKKQVSKYEYEFY